MRHTFRTYERLKREQDIDTLFRTGKAYSVFPLKVIYLLTPRASERAPVRAGFSVPKKKIKKAVDRQRIKRLMREAWRLHKHRLYDSVPGDVQVHLFCIFTDHTMPDYGAISGVMDQIVARLVVEIGHALSLRR